MRELVIGTRGSALALIQAEEVRTRLKGLFPGHDFRICRIKTEGDRSRALRFSRESTGVFVRHIEDRLRQGGIDMGVHSLKDLPAKLASGLVLAAVTERIAAGDALVSRTGAGLSALKPGSSVGTSSPRRCAQLLHYRKDLKVVPLRGNLDTRLKKLESGELEAIVVAEAGLKRAGWRDRVTEVIPFDIMLPAAGQGCIAIETREDDTMARDIAGRLDDADSHVETSAERMLLGLLGAGCSIPVGVLARKDGGILTVEAGVYSEDGKTCIRKKVSGDVADWPGVAGRLAKLLVDEGAAQLLEARK